MKYFLAVFFCFLLAAPLSRAETVEPDPSLSMTTPEGWDYLVRDFNNLTHPTVAHILDCVSDDPAELKQVGWKLEKGKVIGGYCVSFRKQGMRPAGVMLKYSSGKEREQIVKSFIDTYAGEIQAACAKRNIRILEMSADLIEAGGDFILVLDSAVSSSMGEFIRSATVILHDDSLLKIGTVYPLGAPESVVEVLEAMPLSVTWKK